RRGDSRARGGGQGRRPDPDRRIGIDRSIRPVLPGGRATGRAGGPPRGAYSKATAADLILPRLLTGERVSRGLVAGLGHGGVLGRSMRFRFPGYARELDAPDG